MDRFNFKCFCIQYSENTGTYFQIFQKPAGCKDAIQNNHLLAGFTLLEPLWPVLQAFLMKALPLK